MISKDCSFSEFVETVKDKDPWEVIALAIEEADRADRMKYHKNQFSEAQWHAIHRYARHLKELIAYLRYEIQPRRPDNIAYQFYTANWAEPAPARANPLTDP